MCLSTVYLNSGDEKKEIMKEVARIEAEGQGFTPGYFDGFDTTQG